MLQIIKKYLPLLVLLVFLAALGIFSNYTDGKTYFFPITPDASTYGTPFGNGYKKSYSIDTRDYDPHTTKKLDYGTPYGNSYTKHCSIDTGEHNPHTPKKSDSRFNYTPYIFILLVSGFMFLLWLTVNFIKKI
ncbi:hypothetical protein [Aquimarina rubra]|uniref:DUF3592 domain-containing protein n=1 Tax=Aquimarina rubra TaxID=1920033 RepID=A0ABW5LJW8_9FLAO